MQLLEVELESFHCEDADHIKFMARSAPSGPLPKSRFAVGYWSHIVSKDVMWWRAPTQVIVFIQWVKDTVDTRMDYA